MRILLILYYVGNVMIAVDGSNCMPVCRAAAKHMLSEYKDKVVKAECLEIKSTESIK